MIWSLLWILAPGMAQQYSPGRPVGFSDRTDAAEVTYLLPPLDPFEIAARSGNSSNGILKNIEFALERPVTLSPEFNGSWFIQGESRIWQVRIISPGAYSLGLVFNTYRLEPGIRVFVYDPDLGEVKGAFTSRNNKSSGILPVGHLKGDELIVEMQVPLGQDSYGDLSVESVSHAFLDLGGLAGGEDCDPGTFGCSQPCMIDVNCVEGNPWQTEKRSVIRIFTTNQYCTGVLVNNTLQDGIPYILTAEHCLNREYYANRSVFLFNYESPSCYGEDGPTDMSIAGSDLVAVGDSIDFSLVKLSSDVPLDYEPYFAGWDLTVPQSSSSVTIHHPWGDVKKITIDDDAPSIPSKPGDVPYTDLEDYHYFSYWWIKRWDLGSTQGGSSGSPLFNQAGKVIGLLSGGMARCGDSIGYDTENDRVRYDNSFNYDDYYTQLKYAWDYSALPEESLKYWLDPLNAGVTSLNGYAPVGTGPALKASAGKFILYPNPAGETLFLASGTAWTGEVTYRILNMTGSLVGNGNFGPGDQGVVDVSKLEPGIYLIHLTGHEFRDESHQFVILR
ncbi:MAG: trypsin-like peptidase domain-containing protein [Bacteroidales bacterium]